MQEQEQDDVDHIGGFLTPELNKNVDLASAYKKWKDQREFAWFYKVWLMAPAYPIKLRTGQTYDMRRLEQILSDFGFKRPTVVTAKGSASLPLDEITVLRKMLTNLIARQQQHQQPQRPSSSADGPTLPVIQPRQTVEPTLPVKPQQPVEPSRECDDSERLRVEKVLQGVLRDMTALTQERDQLRVLLAQAREALTKATTGRASAPPAPPAVDQAEPERVVPSVPKPVVTDLLADIRKGTTLKKAQPSSSTGSTGSTGLADTLSKALDRRRGLLVKPREDDAAADEEADREFGLVSCEMCYSAVTSQCIQCKNAFYCSRDCQAQHWTEGGHKHVCSP